MSSVNVLALILDVFVKNVLEAAAADHSHRHNRSSRLEMPHHSLTSDAARQTTNRPIQPSEPKAPDAADEHVGSYPSSYVEDSDIVMSLDMDDSKGSIINLYRNNSRVISDLPQYYGGGYTPLTAPELDLINVVKGHNLTHEGNVLYLYSSRTDELAWLIPAILIVTFVCFLVIYVSFYGVKNLELRVMVCCYTIGRCCRQELGQSSSEETDALTSNMTQQHIEMSAYQTNRRTRETDHFIL